MEDKEETEEKPSKLKDNRKKQQSKKQELSVVTGISRSESETMHGKDDLK